jgi:hypothetical protein
MRLLHYTAKPIRKFSRSRKYENAGAYKPCGFWVSVEGPDDWYAWCQAESFGPKDPLVYEVTLAPDARILHIDTLTKLDAFHRDWTMAPPPPLRTPDVRWADVAQEWDGIIIAPYQWERRLARDFMWYYGWDCASGVIWNLNAIESVAPPTEPLGDIGDQEASGERPAESEGETST